MFLAVCDSGAMAAAARRLGMTQPAVSQLIADLERRSGVVLFDRAIRPLGLTPAGAVLRQRASALMADALQIPSMLRETLRGRLPLIRVGIVDSLSRSITAELTEFLSERVEEVSVLVGLTALHTTALATRRLDVVLGVDELADVDGLERWLLVEEPYVLLWAAARREAIGTPRWDRLAASAPMVRFSARSKTGTEIDQHLRRLRVEIPRRYEFDTPFAVTAAVAAGLGWAITTPLCLLEAGLSLDGLAIDRLPGPTLRRKLTLVARTNELGPLPRQIARLTAEALRRKCAAFNDAHCPWLADQVVFGSPARGELAITTGDGDR